MVAKKATTRKKPAARAKKPAKARKKTSARKAKTAARKPAGKARPAKPASRPPGKRAGRKPKNPLARKDLKQFRQMLTDKRRALLSDMDGIQAETLGAGRHRGAGDLSNMPTHPADIGTDNYEQEFSLGLLESEQALLGEIDEALARIKAGTYGICLGTGKPIGKARLKARPWAKYGIEYARMIEQGLVRPGEDDKPPSDDE